MQTQTNKSKTFFLPAFTTGKGIGPDFAQLNVNSKLIEEILNAQSICAQEKFVSISLNVAPEYWGKGEINGEFSLEDNQLVITEKEYWLRAIDNNEDGVFQTQIRQISDLLKEFSNDSVVVIADENKEEMFNTIFSAYDSITDTKHLAEWVGLHYLINFDALPQEEKIDWILRFIEHGIDA